MTPFKCSLPFFAVLALVAQPLQASDDLDLEGLLAMDIDDLRNVVATTASKKAQKIEDSPAYTVVVTGQQIKDRGYLNLLDLLQDLPNVDVQNRQVETFYNTVTIRGILGNNKMMILQDGVRVNAPTGQSLAIHDNFPLHYVKQVEIVFGPGSALYGADALAGVINLITHDPAELDGVEFSTAVGNFGEKRLNVSGGKQLTEDVSLSLYGHLQHADNYDITDDFSNFQLGDLIDFSGTTVLTADQRTGFRANTKSHTLGGKLKVGESFTLGVHRSFLRAPSDTGALPDTTNYDANANIYTTQMSAYAQYDTALMEDLGARFTTGVLHYEMENDSKFSNIFTGFENGYKYADGTRAYGEVQLDYQLDEDNHFIGGLVVENLNSIPKTTDLVQPFDVDAGINGQGFYPNTNNSLAIKAFEIDYTNVGGFLQWEHAWSEAFTSIVGLRYDESSTYDSTLNPRAGVVYKVAPDTTIKAFYGQAYLAPSPSVAYQHFGSFNGTQNANGEYESSFFFIPNFKLQPEELESYEVNFLHKFNANWKIDASVYLNRLDNIIRSAATSSPVSNFIPGGDISFTQRPENLGELESYGGDITVEYFAPTSWGDMNIWGNYSYVDGTSEQSSGSTSTNLPLTAQHKVKAGATFHYDDWLTLTPMVRWVDNTTHYSAQAGNPSELVEIPSYLLVDLHASAKVHENVSAFFTVKNLLDRRYYNAGSVSGLANPVAQPQDPLRFFGGLNVKF